MLLNLGLENWGLLALRLALASVFFVHGSSKLKNWKKMPGFFKFLGVCETLGALSMLSGFLTQLSAIGLAVIMLGATYKKKFQWKAPFTTDKGTGWELDLTLLLTALALLALGGGAFSVDALFGW